jgi:superfamily II DNA or RNA helicase/HKD family nuclease
MSKLFKAGPYDLLITSDMQTALEHVPALTQAVSELPEGAVSYLIDAISRRLADQLEGLGGHESNRLEAQIDLANQLLKVLQTPQSSKGIAPDLVPADNPSVLRWVGAPVADRREPATGLLSPWLFTAGRGSPDLLNELRAEMTSCDRLDILVSFIKVSGVRKIRDILDAVTACDGNGHQRTTIRIITTTYTGATDFKAVEELARLPGCSVKVSLDPQRSRLHAKAWIFHRATGFSTAYVGSANLSHSAMMGGLEWTVKFAQRGQPGMFDRAAASFETLWEDDEFQLFDPDDDRHVKALTLALCQQQWRGSGDSIVNIGFLDVSPKPFQQDILDQLAFEREHGRHRNLLVAATGTGKTVMAALDYRRHARAVGGKPRLLFVAHRDQIVLQARQTFRQVMNDSQFGEIISGSSQPVQFDHVFAVINSVHSRDLIARFGAAYWSMVIVDECHHIAANQFSRFVQAVQPNVLLGLTATPERGDGLSIMGFFDARPDGSPAAELRLWQALDLQLLCPFEYYGCDDSTDFSAVNWGQAAELSQLAKVVEGNSVRAKQMLREWQRLVAEPRACKTLVFCVSIPHANQIADFLSDNGLPALAVHSDTEPLIRRTAPERLARGELCALVTVDLYNEGIDLPFVDTLILLRPTQSAVVFQQQIGRGLRLHEGKTACLIIDFVGQHRQDFRFDRLLGSISGLGRRQLKEGFEEGFPTLPSGCYIHLQKQAREQVLGQLQRMVSQRWNLLVRELQAFASINRKSIELVEFLNDYNLAVEDVFRSTRPSGWLNLQHAAGLLQSPPLADEALFSALFARLTHWDDPKRLDQLLLWCTGDSDDSFDATLAKMLHFDLVGRTANTAQVGQTLERLRASERTRHELIQLHNTLAARCHLLHRPVPGLEHTPLCLHASYTGPEIGVAMGWFTAQRQAPITSGVLVFKEKRMEALFVTLDKSAGFHERIAYQDCAISQQLFKWQTQNSAGPHTTVGQRYLDSHNNGWSFQLFVRLKKGDPFRALGPVSLRSADGSGPMTIIWELKVAMSAGMFREYSAIRGV